MIVRYKWPVGKIDLACMHACRYVNLVPVLTLSFEVGGQIVEVTGHLIIWVPTARAARDPGVYQYTIWKFSNAEAQIFQEIFPPKTQLHTRVKLNFNLPSVIKYKCYWLGIIYKIYTVWFNKVDWYISTWCVLVNCSEYRLFWNYILRPLTVTISTSIHCKLLIIIH